MCDSFTRSSDFHLLNFWVYLQYKLQPLIFPPVCWSPQIIKLLALLLKFFPIKSWIMKPCLELATWMNLRGLTVFVGGEGRGFKPFRHTCQLLKPWFFLLSSTEIACADKFTPTQCPLCVAVYSWCSGVRKIDPLFKKGNLPPEFLSLCCVKVFFTRLFLHGGL